MNLCIDIGNTTIQYGLYDKSQLTKNYFVETSKIEQFIKIIKDEKIVNIIISSVSPATTKILLDMLGSKYNLYFVKDIKKEFIDYINIDKPESLGEDRFVNFMWSQKVIEDDCLIIDMGTATTLDYIHKGKFESGLIMPGIKVSKDSLISKTSLLEDTELKRPNKILTKNTIDNIRSGSYFGHISAINGLIMLSKKEIGDKTLKTILTGGYSNIIKRDIENIDRIDPTFTLDGLNFLLMKEINEETNNI
jgi:type III pantothenate kinase